VLGANSTQIKGATSTRGYEIIHNSNWSQGIGSSISLATQQVLENPRIENVIFFLSDQPFVDRNLIENLIHSHKNEITACRYQDEVGVPAIFARRYFTALSELAEDSGAKKIIKKYLAQTTIVDFEMGHWDIDTKEDIEKLKALTREQS
jgi:molybdenum cofactor cytidylyltransferase